jgi:hypothetical protein
MIGVEESECRVGLIDDFGERNPAVPIGIKIGKARALHK